LIYLRGNSPPPNPRNSIRSAALREHVANAPFAFCRYEIKLSNTTLTSRVCNGVSFGCSCCLRSPHAINATCRFNVSINNLLEPNERFRQSFGERREGRASEINRSRLIEKRTRTVHAPSMFRATLFTLHLRLLAVRESVFAC
jgi:hypothetical protein